jgi:class 3 adenylate cyclase/tetratricopeptide (TPR) repeat protein
MAGIEIFLPKTVIRLVSEIKGNRPFFIREGTILFCDVAGFTPLTEALSGMGKEGSEELTKILNRYFTEMIEIIDELGGDVIRFGGDAMTILFPKGHEDNAVYASHLMMAKMESFREIKTKELSFSLAMKIGVAYGKTVIGVLGNRETGMDYYAAGLPLDESAEAEHRAEKGMIVVHPSFQRISGLDVIPMADGFGESRPAAPAPHIMEQPDRKSDALCALENLVPRYLLDKAGQGTLGEHRGATVIFLGFEGLRIGNDDRSYARFHTDLNTFFVHITSTAKNYGGIVNKVDMGDKGMKAILLFGSPYALENKEEMAVRCALELRDANPLKEKITVKMGVTSSALFTGPVGSEKRREFTVMGDGINTAARFMGKAPPNEIYCDEKTRGLTFNSVAYTEIQPLALKGKKNAVQAFVPNGFAKKEEHFELPVIVERDEIQEKLKNLLMEKAKPVLVTGGAGLGKTTLIEWTRKESLALNIPTTRVFLAPYHKTRSYSLWKGALRNLLGIRKNDDAEKIEELRDESLDKEYKPYGVLLNAILGIEEKEKDIIRSLSPREKKELTFAIVEKLLLRSGERIILADNLEMADPLSLDLLNFLFQGGTDLPIKFAASCRSAGSDLEKISANFEKVELKPLSESGTRACLDNNIKIRDASDTLLAWFYGKTHGNPKLISAIAQILADEKIILKEGAAFAVDEDRLFSTPFPEKLEDIYLKKIDELPREEREVVQVASVLGYSVSLFLLSFAVQMEKDSVRRISESLAMRGIFRSDSWGERSYMKFSDGLLRDAVYSALPFSLKKEVHLKCATFLEGEGKDNPGLYSIIAGHFKGAGDVVKANEYNKKSAFDALSRFDNITAMRFLEEVCEGILSKENLDCGFSLMEVYGILGRAKEEVALISRIEAVEETFDCRERLRFLSFEAKKAIMERDFLKAEKLFILSETLAADIRDNFSLAKIYVNMVGGLYGPKGEFDKAQEALDKCLALPGSKESEIFKVTALFNSANIMKHRGQNGEALATFKRAYKKAGAMKLLPQMANIAQSIASLLYSLGEYKIALVWATRAKKWAETFGLRQLLLLINHLIGVIEHGLGVSEKARKELQENVEKARRFCNFYVEAISQEALIDTCSSLLNLGDSLKYGASALETAKNIRSSMTFKYTLVEILRLFESLSAKKEAKEFLDKGKYFDFLKELPGSPAIEPLLDSYVSWLKAEKKNYSEADMETLSPDLKNEYIVFHLAMETDRNNANQIAVLLRMAFGSIRQSPSISSKIKLYYYSLKYGYSCPPELKREIVRVLKNYPLGIYGLRTAALIWKDEKIPVQKKKIRRLFIARLYNFRTKAPSWAFSRLLDFAEIREALVGEL